MTAFYFIFFAAAVIAAVGVAFGMLWRDHITRKRNYYAAWSLYTDIQEELERSKDVQKIGKERGPAVSRLHRGD